VSSPMEKFIEQEDKAKMDAINELCALLPDMDSNEEWEFRQRLDEKLEEAKYTIFKRVWGKQKKERVKT